MLSHHKTGQVEIEAPSLDKGEHNHLTLAAALACALCSASVLDQAIMAFFLQPQEIRLAPKKMQKPPIERWSSWHPAQSASKKAWREWVQEWYIWRPKQKVCFR